MTFAWVAINPLAQTAAATNAAPSLRSGTYQSVLVVLKQLIHPLPNLQAEIGDVSNRHPLLARHTAMPPICTPAIPSYKQINEINLSLFQILCVAITSTRNKPHFPPFRFLPALNKPVFSEPVHLFSI
jgi:hypothetical protein